MSDRVGNNKTAGHDVYYHPRSLESQSYPGFSQCQDRYPGTILIVGSHEVSGGTGPYAFNSVQLKCFSSMLSFKACHCLDLVEYIVVLSCQYLLAASTTLNTHINIRLKEIGMEIIIVLAVVVAVGTFIYFNRSVKSLDINNDGKIDTADAVQAVSNATKDVKSTVKKAAVDDKTAGRSAAKRKSPAKPRAKK